MQSILNLTKTNKLILAVVAFLVVLAIGSGRASAATLSVAGGCTLNIAIDSVNAGANQSGCTAAGSYGTNDTISIPVGTTTLTADLPQIEVDVKISGAGMGSTAIDAAGYNGINARNDALTIEDLKITNYSHFAIRINSTSVILDHVEVDGQGATSSQYSLYGITILGPDAGGASSITADNVYIHSMSAPNYIHGFIVDLAGSSPGAMTVTLTNTTVSDLHSSAAGVNAFMINAGLYVSTAGGTVTSMVDNTTLNNITAAETAAGFGTFGLAGASGVDISLRTTVRNATVTGIAGAGSVYISQSPAFFSAGAADGGGVVTTVLESGNSLIANNRTNNVPSNCYAGDVSTNFGGSGGTVNASIISAGHNISDDATCAGFTQAGDQQNISNIISTLGPIQNNGGSVPTRALLAGSPAIASGSSVLGITTDARGVARPGTCPSVGAFQFEGAVCGASTSPASANPVATAPNTGIGSASVLTVVIAAILGASSLAYSYTAKRQ